MASYYVNPSAGSDTNPGTEAGPFATHAHAVSVWQPGDRIFLSRGYKYPPIVVANQDGTDLNRYRWAAYGFGSDPVVSAFSEPAGSWVDQGNNLWAYQSASLEQVNVLCIAGVGKPVARWPKRQVAEYYPITSVSGNSGISDTVNLSAAPNFVGGEMVSKKRKWTIDRATITGQTSTSLTVTGDGLNYVSGNGYFVQNHVNCVTDPGDWAFDASTDTVHLYSEADPNGMAIEISQGRHALDLQHCNYHEFEGIVFEGGWEHNIFIQFSVNVSFTGCTSQFAGVNGLQTFVSANCSWNGSYMYDINNTGVNNRDNSPGLTVTGSSFIRVAYIPGMGQSGNNQQNGVQIGNTEHDGHVVGNFFNLIGNLGVYYRGNNCYVANNYGTKCAHTVADSAVFYTFGSLSSPYTNMVCEYNIAYDCLGNLDGWVGNPEVDSCGFYADDNTVGLTLRYNFARKCGYNYYVHNVQGGAVHDNIGIDGRRILFLADDNAQGEGLTNRIRNLNIYNNQWKALAGQKAVAVRVIGEFAADGPFDFGVINNNTIDAVDANPINVHLVNNFDNDLTLAQWRATYGFDVDSTEAPIDADGTVFLVNYRRASETFPLDGIYRDWDGVENASGEVTLSRNESILLFRVSDFPGPGYPVGKYPGMRFVTLTDRYGQAVYDTYVRAKANNAEFGATLMDIKPIADKVLAHAWDMVNVPVAYKDNALYSLLGQDLLFSGGGGGSCFDKDGLLVTELPNDRPRFTFDPANVGKFEGLYLEVEDTNLLTHSNNFDVTTSDWTRSSLTYLGQTYPSPEGVNNAALATRVQYPRFMQDITPVPAENSEHYLSIFYKPENHQYATLVIKTHFSNGAEITDRIIYALESNTVVSVSNGWDFGKVEVLPNDWHRVSVKRTHLDSLTNDLIRAEFWIWPSNYNENTTPDQVYFYGAMAGDFANVYTSYIKTTSTPVTRPADTLQATGLINIASPYSLFEIRNGQGILRYVDPGAGTVRTYIDGVYIGEEAVTPSVDLLLDSQGSDKLLAAAYHSGSLTEQERLTRSALWL